MKTNNLFFSLFILVGISIVSTSCKDESAVDNSALLVGKWVEHTYGKYNCVDETSNYENVCTANCDIYEFLSDGTFIYDYGDINNVTRTYEIFHEHGRVLIDYGSSITSYIYTFEAGNLVLVSPELYADCEYKIVLKPV